MGGVFAEVRRALREGGGDTAAIGKADWSTLLEAVREIGASVTPELSRLAEEVRMERTIGSRTLAGLEGRVAALADKVDRSGSSLIEEFRICDSKVVAMRKHLD